MTNDLPGASPEGATTPSDSRGGTRNLGRGAVVPAHPGSFLWTPENIRRLIELAATKTVPEIARIMGTSKNSVVGKAHRMGIFFPTFRAECAKDHREIARMILAGMGVTEIARALGQHISTVNNKIDYLRKRDRAALKIMPLTLADLGPDQCCWPLGGPKEPAKEFCGEPVVNGKSYCQVHQARAYQKPSHDKGQPFHIGKYPRPAE